MQEETRQSEAFNGTAQPAGRKKVRVNKMMPTDQAAEIAKATFESSETCKQVVSWLQAVDERLEKMIADHARMQQGAGQLADANEKIAGGWKALGNIKPKENKNGL